MYQFDRVPIYEIPADLIGAVSEDALRMFGLLRWCYNDGHFGDGIAKIWMENKPLSKLAERAGISVNAAESALRELEKTPYLRVAWGEYPELSRTNAYHPCIGYLDCVCKQQERK